MTKSDSPISFGSLKISLCYRTIIYIRGSFSQKSKRLDHMSAYLVYFLLSISFDALSPDVSNAVTLT